MSSRLTALFDALSEDLVRGTGQGIDFYRSVPALLPDFTHAEACAFSLTRALGKKFAPGDTSEQDARAYAKFLEFNERSRDWELNIVTPADELYWGYFKRCLHQFFNLGPTQMPLLDELDSPFLIGRCGPGASLLANGDDFYTKLFSSRLSFGSPVLREHFLRNVGRFPRWLCAELDRSAAFGAPIQLQSSVISFAPKSDTISRVICTEPSLNMFYQLGAAAMLTDRLQRFFSIDLRRQPDYNRELARFGSLDGRFATIDLESASDSVSYKLCKKALPKEAFELLSVLRMGTVRHRDTTTALHMFSTMGNGFTFPLQSIIFACAVSAVYQVHDRKATFGAMGECGVFGDDIVVHSNMYHRVVSFLTLLGFKVNSNKSFNEGAFRESCGFDFYHGINIRGIYAKALAKPQDFYSLINAATAFTARTGFVLSSFVKCCLRWCDASVTVPMSEDPSSGIRVPMLWLKKRKLLPEPRRKSEPWYQAIGYVCYVPIDKKIRIGDGYVITPKGVKQRIFNWDGLVLSLLFGVGISSGFAVRQRAARWRRTMRSCSFWDALPNDYVSNNVTIQRVKNAVVSNLENY